MNPAGRLRVETSLERQTVILPPDLRIVQWSLRLLWFGATLIATVPALTSGAFLVALAVWIIMGILGTGVELMLTGLLQAVSKGQLWANLLLFALVCAVLSPVMLTIPATAFAFAFVAITVLGWFQLLRTFAAHETNVHIESARLLLETNETVEVPLDHIAEVERDGRQLSLRLDDGTTRPITNHLRRREVAWLDAHLTGVVESYRSRLRKEGHDPRAEAAAPDALLDAMGRARYAKRDMNTDR